VIAILSLWINGWMALVIGVMTANGGGLADSTTPLRPFAYPGVAAYVIGVAVTPTPLSPRSARRAEVFGSSVVSRSVIFAACHTGLALAGWPTSARCCVHQVTDNGSWDGRPAWMR